MGSERVDAESVQVYSKLFSLQPDETFPLFRSTSSLEDDGNELHVKIPARKTTIVFRVAAGDVVVDDQAEDRSLAEWHAALERRSKAEEKGRRLR